MLNACWIIYSGALLLCNRSTSCMHTRYYYRRTYFIWIRYHFEVISSLPEDGSVHCAFILVLGCVQFGPLWEGSELRPEPATCLANKAELQQNTSMCIVLSYGIDSRTGVTGNRGPLNEYFILSSARQPSRSVQS